VRAIAAIIPRIDSLVSDAAERGDLSMQAVRRAEELLMDAAPTACAAALEAKGELMNYRGQYSGCIQVGAGKLPEVLRCRIVDEKLVVRRAALNCCTAVLTQDVWNATPGEAAPGEALKTYDRRC
jgi:hypothetical protein